MQEHSCCLDKLRIPVCKLVPGAFRYAAVKDGGESFVYLIEYPVRDPVHSIADDGLMGGVNPLQEEGALSNLLPERLKALQGSAIGASAEIRRNPEERRSQWPQISYSYIEGFDIIYRLDLRVELDPRQGFGTAGFDPGSGTGFVDIDNEHVSGVIFVETGGLYRARVYCAPEDPVAVPVPKREIVKPALLRAICGYGEVNAVRENIERAVRDADPDAIVSVLAVRDPRCRVKATLFLDERACIEGDVITVTLLPLLSKQGNMRPDPLPAVKIPDASRHHGVVIAWQDIDRDRIEPVKDVDRPLHGDIAHVVILKRIPGEQHEVHTLLLRKFNDTSGRIKPLLPDSFCFFAGMRCFHADLPIGRVQEPDHLTASP